MNKINKFTPKVCKEVVEEINEVLATLGDKLGLKISTKGGSYCSDSFTTKLNILLPNAKTDEEKALESQLTDLFLDPQSNSEFELVGYKTRASKRPFVIIKRSNGARYVTSENQAIRYFRSEEMIKKMTRTVEVENIMVELEEVES
tara:strand:+ start:499 stop:936 length:438 start_codon:yes stop_codon:yes gene_type:complete